MGKVIKKALKISLWILSAVILMVAALLFSLRFKSVQTYVARKAAGYFSKELHTTVSISSLDIKLFRSVELKGFLVKDLDKDTLLITPSLTVTLNGFSIPGKKIAIQTAQLDGGQLFLKKYKEGGTNLDFIIRYFKSGKKPPAGQKKGKPYLLTLEKIALNSIRFRYRDFKSAGEVKKGAVNFSDLDLTGLHAAILHLDTKNHIAKARLEGLTFKDKSGFYLKDLTADATIDSNKLEFARLHLATKNTLITDYLKLSFSNYGDFSKFAEKVFLNATISNSVIDPKDLSYFVPGTASVDLRLAVSGKISGYVGHIKAKDFSLRAGQATYMKGNFDIMGLPDIDETLLDLEFEQVYSNKKDAELIMRSVTGKSIKLPDIIGKLGDIYFKGRFTGFPKDFIADGEFKTSLGRVVSDVNMKLGKVPVYSGSVKAFDFNMGKLLDNGQLGRATFAANLKGQSFDYQRLNESLEAKVAYFDFKDYRYTNIVVNGIFNKKLFKGKVMVNDKNLSLDFNGGIDLNPALPVFNFVATIKGANLHALHFTKDTIQVDADFNTNFSGNNLDNLQGNVFLDKIRLTTTDNSISVDSVALAAEGIGNDRSLSIRSDILDFEIKGQYDLNTLPDYFIATTKKYIPSLTASYRPPELQQFVLKAKIKYFEPLGLLFAPDLKLPDGATVNGEFQSDKNLANVTASAPQLQYKGVKVSNLILDETNMGDALTVIVTSDRVNLNDSLYVKNINMANILRNDSLSLNVKLSDKDATNQLDMNGLIEFGRDTTAIFSLLPSDIIINRESWKVPDKVKFGYDKGKVLINGFQLSRNNQVLSLNGTISSDPEDQLVADFTKFKLASFNSLTTGLGVKFGGELNGKAVMRSLIKNPVIESDLKVDTLAINNTVVGDLAFKADFDNDSRLVKTSMVITKAGKETLHAQGDFNAKSESNSLNFDVTMDNSELIIFEPFIKNLVSNLKGTISADLKLSGTLSNPSVNGTLSMNNAGMTVNYLKTSYHITDKVTVQNSVIRLDNLVLRDPRNSQAIANGKVDLSSIANPVIDVTLKATNFLALNTTSKDNPLYYGTAYGTGTFTFTGPVDNMYISIDAKTEAGTIFNIPLNAAYTVSQNNYISFAVKDSSLMKKKKVNQFNGLTMNFSLNVDENSIVNLYTDIGQLEGRGQSDNLNLNISSAGDFIMTGNYLISSGRFIFTAQDYINKRFTISSGGSIKWTGDPTQAIINLQATYRDRANTRPLFEDAGRPSEDADRLTTVEVELSLSGSLLAPTIAADLNFPDNGTIKDELQTYFSDESNVYKQALSFIVRRQFTAGTANEFSTGELSKTGLGAVSELVFNQFNSFLAQSLGLNFVDLNIRSLNDASATLKLFNERFIFTGGLRDNRSNVTDLTLLGNKVDRDVEVQYLIKRDGSLALRASNRLSGRSVLTLSDPENMYVSAIGLVYRQEFDNFAELWQILSGRRRREEEKARAQAKKEQPLVPPPSPIKPVTGQPPY